MVRVASVRHQPSAGTADAASLVGGGGGGGREDPPPDRAHCPTADRAGRCGASLSLMGVNNGSLER